MADSRGLLAAKFARPQVPHGLVVRQRLLDRLDEAARGEVTLIVAGPGYGKTLLVAAWAETGRPPGPVAWLSLDHYDDSPAAFWSYFLGALRSTGAVPDDNPLASIIPGVRIDEAFVRRIALGIAELPDQVVLVLEDLHEIVNPQVLRSLAFLLRHPVRQLLLVVTTREEHPTPLHRPRIRQRLAEIQAAELSFTLEEAAELLAGHRVQLTAAEISTLLGRTEGWAAGLGLAAMFLRRRDNQAAPDEFTGTERTVAEYMAHEVLAGQPAQVRRFLLLTCVVDRVCGDLADVLTEGSHGQQTLERLAGENALVIRLGSQRPWFRYHPLLTEMLRQQLLVEEPDLVPRLHVKAAHWFAHEQARLYAVSHAVAARDWPLVGHLVTVMAGARVVSTDRRPLMSLVAQIPASALSTTADLALCAAWLAFDRMEYDAIPGHLAHVRTLLAGEDPSARRPTEIVARTFDAAAARAQSDMAALVDATSDVLELLPQVSLTQLPSAPEYRAIAVNNAGVGLFWVGRLGPAAARLRSAIALAESVDVELTQLNAITYLALLHAEQGCLRDADELAHRGLDLARRRGWPSALQLVPAYVALALTHLERNALGEAHAAFNSGIAANRAEPEATQYFALRIVEARILLARGQTDAARLITNQMEQEIGALRTPPPLLVQWLAIAQAQVELAANDPGEVIRRFGGTESENPHARLRICVSRAHLALGDPKTAETLLAPLHTAAPDVGSAVEAWVATALVQDALRQNNRSADAFARAVALAEPQGIRRLFLGGERTRMPDLMERHQWLAQEKSAFVAELLADSTADPAGPAANPPAEVLTDRELDVLRYLPTMLKNQDIAGQLYVSVNTVKAHLRSLYQKLGATQRREAVERARERGLL
ncbi:LuxR C-terminal-related transcriptional regulator [Actinoplanes sp. NPDC049118]|uniref:LuxR C-terminal-related transcriptional regulator n=1 Tax=Actinoplanes sp. NPDC049118 TaxID=3155769 RepID=UPI0033F02E5D